MVPLYVIGVDVGGTNTDAVIFYGKEVIAAAKRPTEENRTNGIVNAIRAALDGLPRKHSRQDVLKNVARVCIGTTHFVNAVTARRASDLSPVAVVRLCGTSSWSLPPFCDFPDDLRRIMCGGVHLASGGFEYNLEPIGQLDEEELTRIAQSIADSDPPVRNVVVSGVFAPHDDPENNQEQRAARILQATCPDISYTLSHKIGLLGLIERENASILNESLKPLAQRTILEFRQSLDNLGLRCAFYLTQNDGTLISAEEAVQFPVFTFSSGPTNSMRGAVFLSGLRDAIVIDIGGTTTDIGVVKDGFPREASSQCKVGGVRTNFSMPDVLSLALGGGSRCLWDATNREVRLGSSVEHRLTTEALCFGGPTCTATDVAIAAGIAPLSICQVPGSLDSLNATMVYAAMALIRETIENGIDCVKMEKADVPVVLVGGGSCLVDQKIGFHGASTLKVPEKHWGVANAIGAALGTVGATVDTIESLELGEGKEEEGQKEKEERMKKARLEVLERARNCARSEAIRKGAVPSEVYIHSEDVVDVAYVFQKVRVKVKAIGPLRDSSGQQEVTASEQQPCHSAEDKVETTGPLEDSSGRQEVVAPKDNPHWPYHSAEDKERDEAACLPAPQVEGGVWRLTPADVECVAVGAGLLGCGGGGDPNAGRLMALQELAQGKEIKVVNPIRLNPSEVGLVSCVAFMGAPAIITEKLAGGMETALVLEAVQRVVVSGVCREECEEGRRGNERVKVSRMELGSGKQAWVANAEDLRQIDISDLSGVNLCQRITHLLCAEAGGVNSLEPLILGAKKGMAVLDADGMGRAFPELQMYTPLIYGCKPYPSCVADNQGEVIACTHVEGAKQLEDFFRVECIRMGMSCGVSIGVLTLQDILRTTVLFSMSTAWQLGRTVECAKRTHSNVLQAIARQQNGIVLLVGKVTDVVRVNEGGFGRVEAVVEGLDTYRSHQVKVLAKNENYLVRYVEMGGANPTDGAVLACTPDLICVVDSDTGYPITTEAIRYGMRVGVLALPANHRLLTAQAMQVVGPAAFGFPEVEYHSPRSLEQIGKRLLDHGS